MRRQAKWERDRYTKREEKQRPQPRHHLNSTFEKGVHRMTPSMSDAVLQLRNRATDRDDLSSYDDDCQKLVESQPTRPERHDTSTTSHKDGSQYQLNNYYSQAHQYPLYTAPIALPPTPNVDFTSPVIITFKSSNTALR